MRDESRLRFLIVDDEQSIRRLCMTVGQGLNFVCSEAETAEAALAAAGHDLERLLAGQRGRDDLSQLLLVGGTEPAQVPTQKRGRSGKRTLP